MLVSLDRVKRLVKAGDTEEAKQSLVTILRSEPEDAEAWALLATLLDDPNQQADCYRRVLRNDPDNYEAAEKLNELTGQSPESSLEQDSDKGERVLRCKQCGGVAEVHYIGEMQDKRAVCSYCGTEMDLPDAFRQVRKKREHERRLWGSKTVEETVVTTRRDFQPNGDEFDSLPFEIQEILLVLKENGPEALDEEALKRLQASGINISVERDSFKLEKFQPLKEGGYELEVDYPQGQYAESTIKQIQYRDGSLLDKLFRGMGLSGRISGTLSPDEILKKAGDPIPPEDRRNCPNPRCGSTIHKDADMCPWCGESLEIG